MNAKSFVILLLILVIQLQLIAACTPTPEMSASEAATIAAAKATEAVAQATIAAAGQIITQVSVTPATTGATATPSPTSPLVPTTTTQTPMPAEMSRSVEMAQGTILFVKESEIISGTENIRSSDLGSITAGQTNFVASNLLGWKFDLSPNGTMVANYGHGYEELQVITLDAHFGAANITPYKIPDIYKGDYMRRGINSVYWSPDSTRLALQADCSLYVVTLSTGEFVEIWHECYPQVTVHKGIIDVAWSPDGAQIAFTVVSLSGLPESNRSDDLHGGYPARLLVASADGIAHKVLDEQGYKPVWSPNGQQILYQGGWRRDSDGDVYCNEKLYVINAAGSGRVQLADTMGDVGVSSSDNYDYEDLSWSSDGERVFWEGDHRLSVIRSDGTDRVILSDGSWAVNYWPQSNRIAWVEYIEPGSYTIFISNLDGTDKIVWDSGENLSSIWSCGDKVVWNNGSTWFVGNLDGSGREVLLGHYHYSYYPLFSPDCSQAVLALESSIEVGGQITIIDLTSTNQIQLVRAESHEWLKVLGWVASH